MFHGKKICILGGTGFIGSWLINAFNQLSLAHGIKVSLTIYTRNANAAIEKFPQNLFSNLEIREFDFLLSPCDLGMFDFMVNAATPTSTKPSHGSREIFFTPTINAIQSIIESARKYGNHPRIVNLSSGAVYGSQPMSLQRRPEGPIEILSSSIDDYCKSKIVSEDLISAAHAQGVLSASSPRLFTFYGPGLPLNQHFAIGNFISDGIRGLPINVKGNPYTKRSYMHPGDLTIWMMKCLLNPELKELNVGSEICISMVDLASLVSKLTGDKGLRILSPEVSPNNYVPDTREFRRIYDVRETVDLERGLVLWIEWLIARNLV